MGDEVADQSAEERGEPFPSPGGGDGLIGMRERARSAGGRIRAGRLAQGGFEVVVELPHHPDGHAETAAVRAALTSRLNLLKSINCDSLE